MYNVTSLQHPTIKTKIKRAIWLAKLESVKNGRGTQYISNRNGHNIIRIDYYYHSGIVAYGDQARNITNTIKQALGL